ncbi:MAG: VWA domain-containing protein, partial [Firmicutes bacterium]|nr:VWA domain-containing protein [Bacillota bacterium]
AGLSWSDPETGESYCYLNLIPRLEAPFDREPLQYIFLIDISGSMDGINLEQAKNALQLCLRNMEAGDSFDIIAFESRCHYFLPAGALPFNQDSLNRASRWIDNLRSLGGTEILEPVRYALDNSGESGTVILLFTDGMVGNEQEIISLTRSRIKQNHLFTFGIDTAVNSHFINKLAEAGNGLPEFIHPGERLEDKVIRQFYRINSPAVKNATVKWSAALHMDCYPLEIPIIFDREPVALVGKYSGALAGTVSLTGQLQDDRFKTELDLADLDDGHNFDFLKKIWAKMKIDHLEKALEKINPRRRETLIEEIVKVSCEYGIGSSQTSFVALLERKNEATGIPETVVVPVAPAAEWRMLSPGFNQFQPGAGTVLFSSTSPAATSAPMPMPKYAGALDSGAVFGAVGSIEDVVRLIALQQQADGSFPAEKGAKNAELSRFENTALAAPALLLSGNPALYRRQIERSVKYLVEAKPQKKLEEFHYFAVALSARLYLEKFKPGEITARRIGSKMEALRERAGSLAALLEKPGLAEKEIVTELLGFTGDRKSSLKNVGPRSGVKA